MMDSGLFVFFFSLGTVVLAEMGDKTQLLAMAFATKFKASKVLLGVFVATIFNHALAVAAGSIITHFGSAQTWIQGIASLSFIFFGLWTIRGGKLEGEETRTSKFGVVATVAFAFFLAEMGDKTQLATVAIAARFAVNPLFILMGTTIGMLIADGIGIIVGVVMCKRIPERTIKLISAGVFAVFGLLGSYQVAHDRIGLSMGPIIAILSALTLVTAFAAYYLIKKSRDGKNNSTTADYCKVKIKEPVRQSHTLLR